jgi:hypothetical protein
MNTVFSIVSIVLYFIVGIISMIMAFKTLTAKKFLPFHEQATGKSWKDLGKPMQAVMLTLIRLSGLGFLVTALLLLVFPIVNYFLANVFVKFAVPALAFLFCAGLFVFNYSLYRKTKAETPWSGSIVTMAVIVAGFVFSLI